MVSITPLSTADVAFDADGVYVWSILLAAERAMTEETPNSQLKTLLVGVRVVGHFLSEFWKARGSLLIGGSKPYHKQIKSCEALPSSTASRQELVACYEKISAFGIHYQKHLMRVFRSLPKTSQHPSRPSLDSLMADTVVQNVDRSKPNVKRPALARDGFKCVVSGLIDLSSYEAFPTAFPPYVVTCNTQCCHILSESAHSDEKTDYAWAAMEMLKMFDFDFRSLLGSGANTLHNVFEEINGQPNTYNVVAARPSFWTMIQRPRQRVTFTVDPDFAAECDAQEVTPELPSRGLLAIRAAVSRVAPMSGAAEQYEIITRGRETSTVMALDGGSAEFLKVLIEISVAA
ncbi:hypothetical protein DFH07DRAFT_946545 [Mycena maculata]|uniref:HNH nuclease domain-containing protein n=1 Tax=Mycena maculata TaxID=230809 RepID=A0AAD7HL88_9AGAR|nr:hypothetical protein DFH07DRAFT_946545 [Mycena maculata]